MKEIIKFEKIINQYFKNKKLLINALTHKSSNIEINNEKLEFVGDRVLGLVLSLKLFELYPNESEGVLDKRFATLVNRKTCCNVAWSINIQDFIIIGNNKKKITKKDEKILSDCCEAVIGAVFIDKGFNTVSKFILDIWKDYIKKSDVTILDSKTKLQEYSRKISKKLPVYKLINVKGPRHNPIFKVSVSIEKSKKYFGLGSSKQQAEQDSASKLIKTLNIN